jgi:HK97 gp10 family phage protein
MKTVKLSGFRELEKALSELPKSTGRNVLRRVAKGALEPMADRARALAPVGQGDLKASIEVSEKRTKRVARINRFDKNTGIQMSMGPVSGGGVLNYATFAEFGTIDTPAFGYMRGAWHGGKDEMLDYVIANLGREIDRAATRLRKKTARIG